MAKWKMPNKNRFKKGIENGLDTLKQPGKMTSFIVLSIVVVVLFVLGISNPIPSNNHTFNEPVYFPGGNLAKEPFEIEYRELKQFPEELAVMQDNFINVPSQSMWSDRGIALYRTFGQVILAVCDTGSASQEDVRKLVASNVLGETYTDSKEEKAVKDSGYFGQYESEYYGGTFTSKDKSKSDEKGYILGYIIKNGDSTLSVYAITKDATTDILSDMRSLTADCVSTIHAAGQVAKKADTEGEDEIEGLLENAEKYGTVEPITDPVYTEGGKDKKKIIKSKDELDEVEQIEYIRYKSYPDELKDSDLYNYTCEIDDGYMELEVTAKLVWASSDFDVEKVYLKSPDGGFYMPDMSDSEIEDGEGKFIWHLHSPRAGTWYIKTNEKLTESDIDLKETKDVE